MIMLRNAAPAYPVPECCSPEFGDAPSGEVYGEPNSRLAFRRPRYTVGTISGDQDIITRPKLAFPFSLDP